MQTEYETEMRSGYQPKPQHASFQFDENYLQANSTASTRGHKIHLLHASPPRLVQCPEAFFCRAIKKSAGKHIPAILKKDEGGHYLYCGVIITQ